MVKVYGMNEKIGTRFVSDKENEVSPNTQELLDQEIKTYLQESYDRAKNILKIHSKELKLLAEALLEKETLDADEIKKIIAPWRATVLFNFRFFYLNKKKNFY